MSIAAAEPMTDAQGQGKALAQGPGVQAWLAPLAAVGIGLIAVALTPEATMRWSLLALAVTVVPMLPTTAVLSMVKGRRPVFELWQYALTASMVRTLASVAGAGAVLMLTDAPVNPFVWVFLLVAGVALAAEKLVILTTSHVAVCPPNDSTNA